ncbi:MAG: hypothetical protein ACI3W5_04370 [Faecousia sp.]
MLRESTMASVYRNRRNCSGSGMGRIAPTAPLVLPRFVEKKSKLNMGLEYDLATGQIQLQPSVKSVMDAAYFGLARFMAVNANTLDDYGGKTNIAFCQACGKVFIKRGNRQKYCGTLECQSGINSNQSITTGKGQKAVQNNCCHAVAPRGSQNPCAQFV